uniref:uncharacterized protein isoform X2 n=1 Tax=Myxine glutinosa TaxID=7769 RepID=UPI00358F8022
MEMKTLVLCTVLLFNCFLSNKATAFEEESPDKRRFESMRESDPEDDALIADIERYLKAKNKVWDSHNLPETSHLKEKPGHDFPDVYYKKNDNDDEVIPQRGTPQRNPNRYSMSYGEPNEGQQPNTDRHSQWLEENIDNVQPNSKERDWHFRCEFPSSAEATREQRWRNVPEEVRKLLRPSQGRMTFTCENPNGNEAKNERGWTFKVEHPSKVVGPNYGDEVAKRELISKCLRSWFRKESCK